MKNRPVAASLLVALTTVGLSQQAKAAADTKPLTAEASISAVVTLTVLDGVLECGTIELATSATACGADQGTATIQVVSNSDYTLAVDDLGGAAPGASDGEVSLFADIGRNGQFVLDIDLSSTGGVATGGDTITISPVSIRASGGPAEQFEATDDYGSYVGEFVVTATGT